MMAPMTADSTRAPQRGKRRIALLGMGVCLAASLLTTLVSAQQVLARPSRLPALGRPVASSDDTTAALLNPANLAFLPGLELRWSATYLDDRVRVPWQGHAFALGLPLPFSLTTALRLDFMNPPRDALLPSTDNYQWLTWALALRLSQRSALGASLQYSFSDSVFSDDISGYSLAYSTRPWRFLGISFVGHDLNDPQNGAGIGFGDSLDLALALRPLSTRSLELGLEAKVLDAGDERVWIPRATLGVDIGPLGRLRGEFSLSDPGDAQERAYLAALSMAFVVNGFGGSNELGVGSVLGDAMGRTEALNLHTELAFRNFREPVGAEGMADQRFAVRLRMEETPNARGHVGWLRELWALAEEPSVDVVVLEVRSAPADSLAHLQELRDALFHLRRKGKRTLCHMEDGGGDALYLCAAANRVLINPAGGVRFAGLKSQYMYFSNLLSKLGIKADFVRIGEHKSAPERFTRTGSTDVSRADKIDLLQQHERQLVEGLSVGRRLTFEQVRARISQGPFIASEAKDAGLIDGLAFDDELEKAATEVAGRSVSLVSNERVARAPKAFPARRGIALVYVEGDMIDGRSRTVPVLGMRVEGSYTIAETLKALRDNPEIAAIVLRIESPGGSSVAADVMWREVKLAAQRKPVIVSMGSVAASGGYYIAAPATRIFASPLTITGSIGIFYGKADVSQLLGKIGLDVETFKTSERADAESLFRSFTPDERRELERKVEQFYGVFVDRVAEGRKLSKQAVDAVGQGRVWTGEQAKAHALVDELGGLRQALEHARKLTDLPADAPIIELPEISSSLLARLLGVPGLQSEQSTTTSELPDGFKHVARALAPFVVHAGDKPLARLEFAFVPPR
jgi:protease-4